MDSDLAVIIGLAFAAVGLGLGILVAIAELKHRAPFIRDRRRKRRHEREARRIRCA
jgi:hypothetical protein